MRSTSMRRVGVGVGITTLLVAGLLVNGGPANAYDARYDGNDPVSTGCANDAITVDRVALTYNGSSSGAYIELRYSPSCRTTWGRLSGGSAATADHAASEVRIHRNADDKAFSRYWQSGDSGWIHTPMVNDANTTSHVHGWKDTGFAIFRGTTINY